MRICLCGLACAAILLSGCEGGVGFELDGTSTPDDTSWPPSGTELDGEPWLGEITFAAAADEEGRPIAATEEFPAGSKVVFACFEYRNMTDGAPWGHYWSRDGAEYIDATDSVWDDGEAGWVAWYVDDPEYLPSGEYEVTLYVASEPVRRGGFTVGASVPDHSGTASFGSITFARGITDEGAPIGATDTFEFGPSEVYAFFSHSGLVEGTPWRREWLYEGADDVARDLAWEGASDGVTFASYGYTDETPLEAGTYTLNLSIDGRLVRSADFEITAEPEPEPVGPGTPQELVDGRLLPAFDLLYEGHNELLRDLAQFALDHRVEIVLEDLPHYGMYRCSTESREPGTVSIDDEFYEEVSWEEVAATMAHELTHVVQHVERGACGCTVENEYYAMLSELYVLQETGRMDLLEENWRGAYDENGVFSPAKLWDAVDEAYPDCPDY